MSDKNVRKQVVADLDQGLEDMNVEFAGAGYSNEVIAVISKLVRKAVAEQLEEITEQYLTEKEVSERLKITIRTLQAWRQSGLKGPSYCKFGSAERYPLSSVLEYEHKQMRQHTSQ